MRNPAGCGTDGGYQRHKAIRETPCPRCYAAHSATNANARAWLRSQEAPDEPLQYTAARAGREPAEALTTHDRARLVAELVVRGWTDQRIAEHTRMTTYTTCRIRERIGLAANQPERRAA